MSESQGPIDLSNLLDRLQYLLVPHQSVDQHFTLGALERANLYLQTAIDAIDGAQQTRAVVPAAAWQQNAHHQCIAAADRHDDHQPQRQLDRVHAGRTVPSDLRIMALADAANHGGENGTAPSVGAFADGACLSAATS